MAEFSEREGRLVKGIGGFYYVESANEIYECKARGAFRKQHISPLAGDTVRFTVRETGENTVDAILPRKNFLIRPPVANVDTLVMVASVREPSPSLLVLDKLCCIAVQKGITPCVVFSKSDLGETAALEEIYRKAGIAVCSVCCKTGEGIETLRNMLGNGISVFTGNSGVGKSSLLNCLDESFSLLTGEISQKLGRGRHTTREVTLYRIGGGYIADTPGFSSLDIERAQRISKEDLPFCFPEFLPYLGQCRFSTCTHTVDSGCKILEAVENGVISPERHKSYVAMYEEVKNLHDWD